MPLSEIGNPFEHGSIFSRPAKVALQEMYEVVRRYGKVEKQVRSLVRRGNPKSPHVTQWLPILLIPNVVEFVKDENDDAILNRWEYAWREGIPLVDGRIGYIRGEDGELAPRSL